MITSGFVSIGCGPARNEGLTHEFSRTRRTTDDLLKSQEALFGGKLLTPTSLTKMTTPFRNGYGCALHLAVSASGRHVFANEGRVPGSNAALQYYSEDKLVIAVLVNLDTQVDALIARDLARAALGAQ